MDVSAANVLSTGHVSVLASTHTIGTLASIGDGTPYIQTQAKPRVSHMITYIYQKTITTWQLGLV